MRTYARVIIAAAAVSAFLVPALGGQTMSKRLARPAAVPLDFLQWIGHDASWLRESLAGLSVKTGFEISGSVLEVSTVDALRKVNRIRTFAYLAAPGLRPPYFDLSVGEPGGAVRCVTLFPRSIAPAVGPLDFGRESFPASEANAAILDLCRVRPAKKADYQGLDRDSYRQRFFDASGDLKPEFADRNADPAFIAEAIDHGFFVQQQDLTGRLRLGAE